MKTLILSVVTPSSPPNNVVKRFVHVYLFPTLNKGEGEATPPKGKEQIYTKEKGW